MESRKITIVDPTTQKTSTIISGAETLGQLKVDLAQNNINFSNESVFYEGLSHTEFSLDDAQLPRDVVYRDEPTNELVIMIAPRTKKIKSGADRMGNYNLIRRNNWQLEIRQCYGKSFTNCSNDELDAFITGKYRSINKKATTKCNKSTIDSGARKAIEFIVNALVSKHYLNIGESQKAKALIDIEESLTTSYSKEEIATMFNHIFG